MHDNHRDDSLHNTHLNTDSQADSLDTPWHSHVTVATVVMRDDRFLCVEEFADPRQPDRLLINQPAGHVEANETLVHAAIRETQEETGWLVNVTHCLGIYTYQPHRQATYYRICFIAETVSHDPHQPLDSDIHQAVWYNLEELRHKQDSLRSPLVLSCLQDALAGKSYPLALISECLL